MPTTPFNIRLKSDLKDQLFKEAEIEDRSASYIAAKAIENHLKAKQHKREAIAAAVQKADKGVFISEEKMDEWIDSWDTDHEFPMPAPDIFPPK